MAKVKEKVDDPTYIGQKSQCSIIVRYVNNGGKLVERFLGFYDVSSSRTEVTLFNLVSSCLEIFEYKTKLIGQCFDGARVMSGDLNGLQANINDQAPQAVFVDCPVHRLNLVLQQSCNSISNCGHFFAHSNGLPTLFHHSPKRTHTAHNKNDVDTNQLVEKYRALHYEILDTISLQIKTRFEGLEKLLFVALLDTSRFQTYSENFPTQALNNLKEMYPNMFTEFQRLKNELQLIYCDDQYHNMEPEPHRLMESLFENSSIFKEAYKLLCLIVTIPFTSVSVERSCSCLK
nr:unnamed protein product [Callosobruchus analis]